MSLYYAFLREFFDLLKTSFFLAAALVKLLELAWNVCLETGLVLKLHLIISLNLSLNACLEIA